ncbi:protein Isd11p [Monosporozyma servazzii]
MAASRTHILSLYRQLIKNSKRFTDYNFREYFLRKSRTEFKQNMLQNDPTKINELVTHATGELAVLKRQAIVSQLYTFDKTVVEPLNHNNKKH